MSRQVLGEIVESHEDIVKVLTVKESKYTIETAKRKYDVEATTMQEAWCYAAYLELSIGIWEHDDKLASQLKAIQDCSLFILQQRLEGRGVLITDSRRNNA